MISQTAKRNALRGAVSRSAGRGSQSMEWSVYAATPEEEASIMALPEVEAPYDIQDESTGAFYFMMDMDGLDEGGLL